QIDHLTLAAGQKIEVPFRLMLIVATNLAVSDAKSGTIATEGAKRGLLGGIVGQIAIIDIVFSLDSVITAVGMVDQIEVMVAAVVTSVGVMLFAAKPIGEFVDRHPSVKVLALAFLVMVGMALTAEAFEVHMPKGYIYAAMAFSLAVESLNIRARAKRMAKA
ncbi:MAG: TerC family protein, partial [Rhizobacter sp.]